MTEIPRHWRLKKQRYGLVGEVCPHCDHKIFPPRDVCSNCGDETKERFSFGKSGEVQSFTKVEEVPAGYTGKTPLTVAIVKMDSGPILTAQIIGAEPDSITVGMPVEMTSRVKRDADVDQRMIVYGYAFVPRNVKP